MSCFMSPDGSQPCGTQRFDAELLKQMITKRGQTRSAAIALKQRQQSRADDSWEAEAMVGIKRRGLHLDKEWGEMSWKMKSSCPQRLKLLKDDGVDISGLRPKDSVAITHAVLARVAARKLEKLQRQAQTMTSGQSGCATSKETAPVTVVRSRGVIAAHQLPPLPQLRKRKRHDTSIEDTGSKRICLMDVRSQQDVVMTEETIPKWQDLKKKVLSEIFMSCPQQSRETCRISIAFPSQTKIAKVASNLELNSTGFYNLDLELRTLADNIDEHGTLELRHGTESICIITEVPQRVIIEGQYRHVAGLFQRLVGAGNGLTHMAIRYFSDDGIRRSYGRAYELSNKTQSQLNDVRRALIAGRDTRDLDILVRWVWVGKPVTWQHRLWNEMP